jgi:hypothetical protein
MKAAKVKKDGEQELRNPWSMQMHAIALDEPAHLARCLGGTIVRCGGWVLSRGISDSGTLTMLFEFQRDACVDIYSGLVGAGLELTRTGHLRFTELCQCTRNNRGGCGTEIASIDLEIRTYPNARTTSMQLPSGT